MTKQHKTKFLKQKTWSVLHERWLNWVNFRLTKIINNRLVRDELGEWVQL